MYVLQKEVRLLRRISKKVLDESTGSPESEVGSHTEGTPVGYHPQWSMSREDSEEEGAEVTSEVRAGCVCVQPKHNMWCRHQSTITHFALFCICTCVCTVHVRTGALYAVVFCTWHCIHRLPNSSCASMQMYVHMWLLLTLSPSTC